MTKSSAAWSSNAAIAGSNFCEPMPRGGCVAGLSYWFQRQQPVGDCGDGKAPPVRPVSIELAGNCALFVALRLPLFRCAGANGIAHMASNKIR